MTEIMLTNHLKQYLSQKKITAVTLDRQMKKVCCAGPPLPSVKAGKPRDQTDFECFIVEHVSIYWHRKIKYSKPTLCISVRTFLLMKNIFVYDPDTVCLCSGGQQDR
ncbi:CC/Se motif family (seleno)protein [Anoxynatronum sibiricum]|uniref:CC/Se motif family (Seleno)protein n=1 Tax=Anoxynatronum sibiricum TaxID=210623 RepID=A0ABU9VPZ4_9CLOT